MWWLLRRFTGCMKTSLLSEAGRRAGLLALREKIANSAAQAVTMIDEILAGSC